MLNCYVSKNYYYTFKRWDTGWNINRIPSCGRFNMRSISKGFCKFIRVNYQCIIVTESMNDINYVPYRYTELEHLWWCQLEIVLLLWLDRNACLKQNYCTMRFTLFHQCIEILMVLFCFNVICSAHKLLNNNSFEIYLKSLLDSRYII